jgi:hypothetical protein
MNHPWLFVAGVSMLGWFLPEVLIVCTSKRISVPLLMNVVTAIAAGLIAAAFVL